MEKTIKDEVKNICGDCDYVVAEKMATAYYQHWKDCHKHSCLSMYKFGFKMLMHNIKIDGMDYDFAKMIFDSFITKSINYIFDDYHAGKITEKEKRKMEKNIKKKYPEYYTKWIIESEKRQQKN